MEVDKNERALIAELRRHISKLESTVCGLTGGGDYVAGLTDFESGPRALMTERRRLNVIYRMSVTA